MLPCSWELRMQKLNSHLVRTQVLNVLPLKPEVGQYIAIHATLTARDFYLTNFYPSVHSPAFFPQNSYQVFPVLATFQRQSINKLDHKLNKKLL